MSENVIRFHGRAPHFGMRARLENVSALFRAIHAGELLSALPECPIAREHHKSAMTLLAFAECEIVSICSELGD